MRSAARRTPSSPPDWPASPNDTPGTWPRPPTGRTNGSRRCCRRSPTPTCGAATRSAPSPSCCARPSSARPGRDRSGRLAEAAYLGSIVTGDLRDAPRLLEQARRAHPGPGGPLSAAVAGAYHLLHGDGDVDSAHRLLVSAIHELDDPRDAHDKVLIEALYTLIMICFFGGRAELWPPVRAIVDRLSPRPPELLAILAATFSDPARLTPAMLARADASVAGLGQQVSPARITRTGIAVAYLDRLSQCREPLQRAVQHGREGGAITSAIEALFLLGQDAFHTGRWDEARQLVDEGLALCATHGYDLLAWPGRSPPALLAAARGDSQQAIDTAREMDAWAAPRRAGIIGAYASHIRGLYRPRAGGFRDRVPQRRRDQPARRARPLRAARPVGVPRPGRGGHVHRPRGGRGRAHRRRPRLPSGPALPSAAPGRPRQRGDRRAAEPTAPPSRRRSRAGQRPLAVRPGPHPARVRFPAAPDQAHDRRPAAAGERRRGLSPARGGPVGGPGRPRAARHRHHRLQGRRRPRLPHPPAAPDRRCWRRRATPTRRSPPGSSSPRGRSPPTSTRSSPNSGSPRGRPCATPWPRATRTRRRRTAWRRRGAGAAGRSAAPRLARPVRRHRPCAGRTSPGGKNHPGRR